MSVTNLLKRANRLMELSILRRRGWTCWNSNPRRRVTGAVQREDKETEESKDEWGMRTASKEVRITE